MIFMGGLTIRIDAASLVFHFRQGEKMTEAEKHFPWTQLTDAQKATIEKTAQGILDARAIYPNASLADLYDLLAMPPELRKAHQSKE
jgi:hypothetical protein